MTSVASLRIVWFSGRVFPKRRLPLAVEWVHGLLERHIGAGDVTVDATAGNGHDTLFLANRVGPEGHVFAFDVQPEALDVTRRLLEENRIAPTVYSYRYFLIVDIIIFPLSYEPDSQYLIRYD